MKNLRGIWKFLFLLVNVLLPGLQSFAQNEMKADEDAEFDSASVEAYLDEFSVLNQQGNSSEARSLLKKALVVADSLENPWLLQAVEREYGDFYIGMNQPDSALHVLEHALERTDDRRTQVQILNLLGTAHRHQSDYEKALQLFNKAVSLADTVEHSDLMSAINANKAVVVHNMGDNSEAISLYQEGIEYAEAAEDSAFLATALNNLGELYSEDSDYEKSVTFLEESISISEKKGYKGTLLMSYNNLGNTYRKRGNLRQAEEIYEKAISLHDEVRPNTPPIQLLHNTGRLFLKMGEVDRAEKSFRESLEHSEAMGIPDGHFHNMIGLAKVEEARGNFPKAADNFKQALGTGEELGSAPFRIEAAEQLYRLYKERENYQQALKYHEQLKSLSDSLGEVEQDQQLAVAETELGLRREQQVNRLLEERQQQQEEQIATQNWLIAASAVIIVAILLFLYMLYRRNVERQRMNTRLENQHRELEELNRVKDKILAILAHDLRTPMASMKGMIYLLREEDLSSDEIEELTAFLEVSVSQNISMLDNLLVWARGQMSGFSVSVEVVDAHEVVAGVLRNFELQAEQKKIQLVNKVSPTVKVKADLNLFKLIFRNLISNSIKFSSNGDCVVISFYEEGNKVVFEVEDSGIGIAEEELGSLFGSNFNSRRGTENEKGSGLGLMLCKEFVEKQQGEISVKSTVGKGTTFSFSLPKA